MKHALDRNEFGLLTPVKSIPFGNGNCFVIVDAVLALTVVRHPYSPTREIGPLATVHIIFKCNPVMNLKFIVLRICAKAMMLVGVDEG